MGAKHKVQNPYHSEAVQPQLLQVSAKKQIVFLDLPPLLRIWTSSQRVVKDHLVHWLSDWIRATPSGSFRGKKTGAFEQAETQAPHPGQPKQLILAASYMEPVPRRTILKEVLYLLLKIKPPIWPNSFILKMRKERLKYILYFLSQFSKAEDFCLLTSPILQNHILQTLGHFYKVRGSEHYSNCIQTSNN